MLLALALNAGAQTGTWSGKLEVQRIRLTLVFHLYEENPTMDSPDQGAKGIPIEVQRTAIGAIKIKVPAIGATYEGQWIGKQVTGHFNQSGTSFPLTLTPGENTPNRPQTPVGPFPYTMEEVSFANGNAMLKGTLTLPEGCSRTTPVLIMVTGSGLQNRDEEIFEHKPFAVIADALARAGVATLRYDDRGFGESTGDLINCTTEEYKNDALAGMELIRERFDRVGVLGHSEGGTIALMLASEGRADFIVSLAGMAVSGAETLLWQNRLSLLAAGFAEATTEAYCSLLAEALDELIAGKAAPSADKTNLPEALKQNYRAAVSQLQTPYMKHFISIDLRPLLGRVSCPVLALNGSKDVQVEPESNLEALRSGLAGNPKDRIESLEGLNHLFQHCSAGVVSEYKEIEETFAPEALDIIISWLHTL